jgi:hypothetical protein
MSRTAAVSSEYVARLRELLPVGTTVYSVVRHVSRSGMRRHIDLYAIKDNKPVYLSGMAADALGMRRGKTQDGIVTDGCGMDMCFHLVYNLGRVLYPAGFDLAPGQYGRNGDTSGHDADGGYALRSESL